MRRSEIAAFFLILLSFAVSVYYYPLMPDRMAIHWNASGFADGYSSKDSAMFLMPGISVFLLVLFVLLPYIDPLKKNIMEFRSYYDGFIFLMVSFFFYLHLISIHWNLGHHFDMSLAMVPALSVLFFYLGVLVENSKRNWFIGIRTPWTLSSDEIWEKTNKLGGKLFKISGVVALLGVYSIWAVIVPVIFSALFSIAYSYFEYRKLL